MLAFPPRRLLLAAALVCVLPASSATAQGPLDPTAPTPEPLPSSQAAPPQAAALTTLAPRADASSAAWDAVRNTYATAYAKPSSWKFKLDGCASRGGANDSGVRASIVEYHWSLEPLEGQTPLVVHTASCAKDVSLTKLGRWRVRLTIRDSRGATNATSQIVTLRDKLVVAVGDSFASGEGNPESQNDVPDWIDEQCHRSDAAWPARVARSLENRSTVVTFLTFACSGAEIRHLTDVDYEGAEPAEPLPPQLVVARRLLGDPLNTATRQADVVLLAAGVNDLHISSILTDCATTVIGSCEVSLAREHQCPARVLRRARGGDLRQPARGQHGHRAVPGAAVHQRRRRARRVRRVQQHERRRRELDHRRGQPPQPHPQRGRRASRLDIGGGHRRVPPPRLLRQRSLVPDVGGIAGHPGGRQRHRAPERRRPPSGGRAGHAARHPRRAGAAAAAPRGALPARAGDRRRHRRSQRARPLDPHVDFSVLWQRSVCGHAIETRRGFGIAGQWRDLTDDPCLRFPLSTVGRSIETRIHTAAGGSLNVQRAHRRNAGWDAVPPLDPGGVSGCCAVQTLGVLEVEYRVTMPLVNG